jgi:Tfp pilus assembly protein PilX
VSKFFLSHEIIENQKGQAIVAVFFVMVLAFSIGVGVSSRFLKSTRVSIRTDNSYRALAIAESLVEKLLVLPTATLRDYIEYDSCGADCLLEFTGDDGLVANATATLGYVGETSDPYLVSLTPTTVEEVNLTGYSDNTSIYVCWESASVNPKPSITGLLIYEDSGEYVAEDFACNSVDSVISDNNFDDASANFGYTNCHEINSRQNPVALRIRSVYNDLDAHVVPASSENLPSQGILIESVGVVQDATRKVSVIRSDPYLPIQFDYLLFQTSLTEPLAN